MAQIVWTEPALSDLNAIAEYIALDHQEAAQKLVSRAFTSVERLEQFPNSGRVPSELPGLRYREIIIRPCRVFYRHNMTKVYILHVMRSEKQLRKFLLKNR
ncbi:MAG: type II toxin-antitoxin system RelE/ParE family toxin [Kofleriaceae bacterium]|nr:type II toxin-antitoxin system RelE/ParE family toxin [Kofleriaceae bacterium]